MSTTLTHPSFARELTDEELATTHAGRGTIVVILEDGTIIVIVVC